LGRTRPRPGPTAATSGASIYRDFLPFVTPEALERALLAAPDIRAAFIVSPTYYGMAADVKGCAEVAHAAGAALVVDNAWGAHFGFHPELPESPLRLGADAVSTHVNLGSIEEQRQIDALAAVADAGDRWHVPLAAMMYPRGPASDADGWPGTQVPLA